VVSTPAGKLSDFIQMGRKNIIILGWIFRGLCCWGFAVQTSGWQVWVLYTFYGIYTGLADGNSSAIIADLVHPTIRGRAYGIFNFIQGVLDIGSSVIAGILWQGVGSWSGFGASGAFWFSAMSSFLAAIIFGIWTPSHVGSIDETALLLPAEKAVNTV